MQRLAKFWLFLWKIPLFFHKGEPTPTEFVTPEHVINPILYDGEFNRFRKQGMNVTITAYKL